MIFMLGIVTGEIVCSYIWLRTILLSAKVRHILEIWRYSKTENASHDIQQGRRQITETNVQSEDKVDLFLQFV